MVQLRCNTTLTCYHAPVCYHPHDYISAATHYHENTWHILPIQRQKEFHLKHEVWTPKVVHVQWHGHNYCYIMLMSSMAPPVWIPDQNHVQCSSAPWILMALSSFAGQAEPLISMSWFRTCNTSLWMRIASIVSAACMDKIISKDSCLYASPNSVNHCRPAKSRPLD